MVSLAPVLVGINGFGSSGRAVLFASLQDPSVVVNAINDASQSTEYMAYMIEHEAPHQLQPIRCEVVSGGHLLINGSQEIHVSHCHDNGSISWGDSKVELVIECSGVSTTRERCWSHLSGGAMGVIVGAQSVDATVVVPGVTEVDLKKALPVICSGSGVGAAIAPFLDILDKCLGIEDLSYVAIHSPRPVDAAAGRSNDRQDWRQSRTLTTGGGTIMPHHITGANTLSKVFPHLKGKILDSTYQVPVQKGCAVDLVIHTTRPATKEQLDELIREATHRETYAETVSVPVACDYFISSDCIGSGKVLYDAHTSKSIESGQTHKILLWVDLECSYATRLLALAKLAKQAIGR